MIMILFYFLVYQKKMEENGNEDRIELRWDSKEGGGKSCFSSFNFILRCFPE